MKLRTPGASTATGFSQNTAIPASTAARIRGACAGVAAAITPLVERETAAWLAAACDPL